MKKFKKIPKFKTEDEEREFWSTHDSTEYVDWSKAKRLVLPNLTLSEDLMEFKLPLAAVKKLKSEAKKQNISSSDLAKQYVLDGLKRDHQRPSV